jgi:hypothetical protein
MMTPEKLYKICVNNGLSPYEARKLSRMKTNQNSNVLQNPDVVWKSGLIQKAIKSRRNFILGMRNDGYNDEQIKKAIRAFYKGQENQGDAAVMRFLKLEYSVESAKISNYQLSVLLRSRAQINRVARVVGVHYGKKAPALPKPKLELFVKQPQDNFLGKI